MKKIAVTSTKGGVGKTTVTAELALAISKLGFTTGTLDLDSSSPTLHIAFGLTLAPLWGTDTVNSQILPTLLDNGLEMVTMASHWRQGKRITKHGVDKADITRQLLGPMVKWRPDTTYLIIDSPPSMSEEIFVIAEDREISGYIIVTQPQAMSIADIERLVDFCLNESLPVYGIISNFDGCRGPQGEVFYPYLGKRVDVSQWCTEHKVPYLAAIPQVATESELTPIFLEVAQKVLTSPPILLPRHDKLRKFKAEAIKIFAGGSDD